MAETICTTGDVTACNHQLKPLVRLIAQWFQISSHVVDSTTITKKTQLGKNIKLAQAIDHPIC